MKALFDKNIAPDEERREEDILSKNLESWLVAGYEQKTPQKETP